MLNAQYDQWVKSLFEKLKQNEFAYIIQRKTNNNQDYYFYDVSGFNPVTFQHELLQVIWTKFQRNAALFDTEEQVEEFKSSYISPRKASIIRIAKPPQTSIMMMY